MFICLLTICISQSSSTSDQEDPDKECKLIAGLLNEIFVSRSAQIFVNVDVLGKLGK